MTTFSHILETLCHYMRFFLLIVRHNCVGGWKTRKREREREIIESTHTFFVHDIKISIYYNNKKISFFLTYEYKFARQREKSKRVS